MGRKDSVLAYTEPASCKLRLVVLLALFDAFWLLFDTFWLLFDTVLRVPCDVRPCDVSVRAFKTLLFCADFFLHSSVRILFYLPIYLYILKISIHNLHTRAQLTQSRRYFISPTWSPKPYNLCVTVAKLGPRGPKNIVTSVINL